MRDAGGAVVGLNIGAEPVKYRTALRRLPDQPYRQDLVEFANGNVTLHGTLFAPANGMPRATVVFIHGTGYNTASSAYEMGLAKTFLDRGIAVLLYYKRGCGISGGDWRTASLHDLANDAAARSVPRVGIRRPVACPPACTVSAKAGGSHRSSRSLNRQPLLR